MQYRRQLVTHFKSCEHLGPRRKRLKILESLIRLLLLLLLLLLLALCTQVGLRLDVTSVDRAQGSGFIYERSPSDVLETRSWGHFRNLQAMLMACL